MATPTDAEIEGARTNIAAMGKAGAEWLTEMDKGGGISLALAVGEQARVDILAECGASAGELASAFEGLDGNVRVGVYRELSNPYTPRLPPVGADELEGFAETGAGKILVGEWGSDAARIFATFLYRWDRLTNRLNDTEFDQISDFWCKRLHPHEQAAVLRQLVA